MKKDFDLLLWASGGMALWYFTYYCLQSGSDDQPLIDGLPAIPAPPFLPSLGGCEFPCTLIHHCDSILDMGVLNMSGVIG